MGLCCLVEAGTLAAAEQLCREVSSKLRQLTRTQQCGVLGSNRQVCRLHHARWDTSYAWQQVIFFSLVSVSWYARCNTLLNEKENDSYDVVILPRTGC